MPNTHSIGKSIGPLRLLLSVYTQESRWSPQESGRLQLVRIRRQLEVDSKLTEVSRLEFVTWTLAQYFILDIVVIIQPTILT